MVGRKQPISRPLAHWWNLAEGAGCQKMQWLCPQPCCGPTLPFWKILITQQLLITPLQSCLAIPRRQNSWVRALQPHDTHLGSMLHIHILRSSTQDTHSQQVWCVVNKYLKWYCFTVRCIIQHFFMGGAAPLETQRYGNTKSQPQLGSRRRTLKNIMQRVLKMC